MDILTITHHLKIFLRRARHVMSVRALAGGKREPAPTRTGAGMDDSPFVLVAHGSGGRWDVYAKHFDNPLASFDERQAACDYASDLAKARKDSLVLIRDQQKSGPNSSARNGPMAFPQA